MRASTSFSSALSFRFDASTMSGYQRHFRQQVALGNFLLLFRYSDGVLLCSSRGEFIVLAVCQ